MRAGPAKLIYTYRETRRLRRSFSQPFIADAGRDSFRFYERGGWVEMMLGDRPRRIYHQDIRWRDTNEILTEPKRAEVMSRLCEHLDRHKIRWEFYASGHHE